MIRFRHTWPLAAVLAVVTMADWTAETPLGLGLVPEAQAIIGRPLTPISYAGVARRTTRRRVAVMETSAVAAESAAVASAAQPAAPAPAAAPSSGALPLGTIVASLPSGCSQMTSGGVQYYKCGADYYRTAFQGTNLVYVTTQP